MILLMNYVTIICKLESSYTSWTNDLDECKVYESQRNLTNSTLQVVRNYECTAQKCLSLGEIVLLVLKQNDPPDKCLMKVSNVENVIWCWITMVASLWYNYLYIFILRLLSHICGVHTHIKKINGETTSAGYASKAKSCLALPLKK